MGNEHDWTEDLLQETAAIHAARVEVAPHARAAVAALNGDLLDPRTADDVAQKFATLQRVLAGPTVARAREGLDEVRAIVEQGVPA